jgi:branched-chain amino acid transport system substrate-binding protein
MKERMSVQHTTPRRWAVPARGLVLLLVLAGCTDPARGSDASRSATHLKVAYLENLAPEGAYERVVPAFQGAKLALDQAFADGDLPLEVEVVAQDVGDPERAADVLAADAADPSYVTAIVSPYWSEPSAAGERLSAAGMATVSLSAVNPDPTPPWHAWFRAVAPLADQASAIAEALDRSRTGDSGICVASDGSAYGDAFARAVGEATRRHVLARGTIPSAEPIPVGLLRQIRTSGCGAVVFGGFGSDAALIRIELDAAGLRKVRLVGADAMRDRTFLSVAGPSGDGTIASCSCVDLGTAESLPAQQFIHDYQSEFGGPPAAYAVEGWDVGHLVAAAVRSGARTRSEVARALQGTRSFAGLGNTYTFSRSGELPPGVRVVQLFRATGGRWLPLGPGPAANA